MLEVRDESEPPLRSQAYDVKRMIKTLRAIPPAIEEKARVSGTLKSVRAIQKFNVPDFIGTQYMTESNIAAMMEQHDYSKAHEFTAEVTLDEVLNSNRLMKKELEGILQQLNETIPDRVEWAKEAMEVGAGFAMTGDGNKAKDILQQCLSSLSGRYGSESEPVAKVHSRLAAAHHALGKYNDQRTELERAVGIWRKAAKPDVTEYYLALTDLSAACGSLGLTKQQTQLSEEASQLIERNKTEVDDVTRVRGLTNVAAACGDAGKPEEKKEMLERALAMLGSTRLPISDIEIGMVLENLAAAHGELGDPVSKLLCQQRAVHLVKRHYGTEHVQYARAAANLGAAYGDLGDHLRQRRLLEEAYKVMEEHYGPQHVDVARTAVMLSAAYTKREELEKGIGMLDKAVETMQAWYSSGTHLEIGRVYVALAELHGRLGDNSRKQQVLTLALQQFEQCLEPRDHALLVQVHQDLADVCYDMGDNDGQQRELEMAEAMSTRGS